jgi:hypothetical protein
MTLQISLPRLTFGLIIIRNMNKSDEALLMMTPFCNNVCQIFGLEALVVEVFPPGKRVVPVFHHHVQLKMVWMHTLVVVK